MVITKFVVGNWSDKPNKKEYARETEHFYVRADKRRDAKISRYERYFDTEVEAIQFIADRESTRKRNKEIDQIKRHAVELLEAAERYLEFRHTGDIGMGHEYSGEHPQTQLKNVIAKAKSPTGNT